MTQAVVAGRAWRSQAGCFREGSFIAFDGVSIVPWQKAFGCAASKETPTGTPLLKGLSFEASGKQAVKPRAGGARPTSGDLWAQRRREVRR